MLLHFDIAVKVLVRVEGVMIRLYSGGQVPRNCPQFRRIVGGQAPESHNQKKPLLNEQ